MFVLNIKMINIFLIFVYLFFQNNCTGKTQAGDPFTSGYSILVFGDWGREGNKNQLKVAKQMGISAKENDIKFIIALGDNFYENGVEDLNDKHWKKSFENVYTDKSLQIPWYLVLGNHDYRGNVQAQIDYSKQSNRWIMPARYYVNEVKINDSTDVLFVYTDTNPFLESYRKSSKYKNVLEGETEMQLKWLDSVLTNSKAKWKIVSGHHPLYSYGDHGNTVELIEKFEPLFEKHNVNLYLSGHDHDMQHIYTGKKTNYFVSGAGSNTRSVGAGKFSKYAKGDTGGFLILNFETEKINSRFIDDSGNILYKTEIE